MHVKSFQYICICMYTHTYIICYMDGTVRSKSGDSRSNDRYLYRWYRWYRWYGWYRWYTTVSNINHINYIQILWILYTVYQSWSNCSKMIQLSLTQWWSKYHDHIASMQKWYLQFLSMFVTVLLSRWPRKIDIIFQISWVVGWWMLNPAVIIFPSSRPVILGYTTTLF